MWQLAQGITHCPCLRLPATEPGEARDPEEAQSTTTGKRLGSPRYFLIKSFNFENVDLSKRLNIWSTHPHNASRLNAAYNVCQLPPCCGRRALARGDAETNAAAALPPLPTTRSWLLRPFVGRGEERARLTVPRLGRGQKRIMGGGAVDLFWGWVEGLLLLEGANPGRSRGNNGSA
jgi:hypothetical protein